MSEDGVAGDAFGKLPLYYDYILEALCPELGAIHNGVSCLFDGSIADARSLHRGFKADHSSSQRNPKSNAAWPPKPLAR